MKKCINCGREEAENNAANCKECGGLLEEVTVEETVTPFQSEEISNQQNESSIQEEQNIISEETAIPETPKKKKTSLIVLIAILVIVIVGGAVGTTMYLLNNDKNDNYTKNEQKEEKDDKKSNKKGNKKANDGEKELTEEEMKEILYADENLVMVIDGMEVTQADYNLLYWLIYDSVQMYQMYYGDAWYNTKIDRDGITFGEYIKEGTVESLKEYAVYEQIAREYGITVDESKIDESVAQFKSYYGEDICEKANSSEEALRLLAKREELYNLVPMKMVEEGGIAYISDETILPEFEENYMRVQHVLIGSTFENADENGDDPEALAKAQEVIAKLDGGADFDSLIEEYNEDPGMTKGKYYTFTKGVMVAEFEEASMNLQVGEYTKEPVKTSYGYHIIKKYELTTDCDEFKAIKIEKSKPVIEEFINEKFESIIIVQKDDVIETYIEEWLKELGVDTSLMPSENEQEETYDVPDDDTEIETEE